MTVLALDLGGSHIEGGLVRDGRVLASFHLPSRAASFGSLQPALEQELKVCCRQADVSLAECAGLGVGIPSLVDGRSNEVLCAFNKFPDITAKGLAAWSEQAFGLPVRLENDAALAVVGEHAAGNAQGANDVVLVTLGTGIGTGTLVGGQLLRSRLGHAGSLGGHLIVRYGGRPCACGAVGCAEAEASTSVLPSIVSAWPGFSQSALASETIIDFQALFAATDKGDAVACAVMQHCLEVWSALAVTLVHAYGPEVLLFGGGVLRRGEDILQPIREAVARHTWKTSRGTPRVAAAALGHHAALIGAETLFA